MRKNAQRTGHNYATNAHPVVALVLGAGGSRGFAHVSVIKALEAEGIQPEIVVGVSSVC